jgi:hypothetical protein
VGTGRLKANSHFWIVQFLTSSNYFLESFHDNSRDAGSFSGGAVGGKTGGTCADDGSAA